MKSAQSVASVLALLGMAVAACSASSDTSSNAGFSGPTGNSSVGGGTSSGGGAATIGADAAAPVLPPEVKTESAYQSPVATGSIVWTANPTSGRVAYVDAVSFAVQTVQAGDGPTYLAAVPNPDPNATTEAAIVLNVLSQNATLLERDSQSGNITSANYPSPANANAWALSPSGRWAIAWADATRVTNPDPTDGFQDVVIMDLNTATTTVSSYPLSVGYRPSQIAFSHDESRAFAVTQDGISVIDLTLSSPAAVDLYPLSAPLPPPSDAGPADAAGGGDASDAGSDAGSDATPDAMPDATPAGSPLVQADAAPGTPTTTGVSTMPDVSFTLDGNYALVRVDGVPAITVVSLADGTPTAVALPSAPTDLTVAPDGTFAVAVLRSTGTVAVLPLPGILSNPASYTTTTIPGETIGRAIVAEDTTTKVPNVLLFTTVGGIDDLTVLTLGSTPTFRTMSLHAPLLAVFPTADGQNAIVLHTVTPTATVKGAFSIVPITKTLPSKIVSLASPPLAVALAPTSDRALVTTSDNVANFGVELAVMATQTVTPFTLASPPTAVGIAAAAGPDGTGFVAQDDADGRITFVDLSTASARTITGFELQAIVAGGSGQ
jgi:hypothetical protein